MRRWRYRPLQAAAVAALAALITACAAFAPLYYRAMQQSLAEITLDNAPVIGNSLQLTSVPAAGSAEVASVEDIASSVPSGVRDDFRPPILGYTAASAIAPGGPDLPAGDLIWRGGACRHLTFEAGGCPSGPGEIAVSQADVDNFGYDVGSTVKVLGAPTGEAADPPAVALEVVGVYRQRPGDYWLGQTLTGRSGTISPGPPSFLQHDTWITDRETVDGAESQLLVTSSTAGYLLDRDGVGVDELLDLGPAITALHAPGADSADLRVVSGLPELADDVQHQIDQSRVTVPLLLAQLCLLVLVVLWLVLLAMTEQRRPEVALARLHGRGRRGARALLLVELLPITLVSVVPGAVLALLAAWFARAVVLPGEPPFEIGWPFLVAVALSAVVLAVLTVVAVGRVVREPVERLLRRVPPRRTGWSLGVGEALVIAGAGGIVIVFATGGLDGPSALAAPGLLAIVVGLVLAHLTTPTAALVGRRELRRGRVRSGVSVLDAARSPATSRIVAMVTLAAALAVFSADALAVGDRNRTSAAEQEAGAARVADVSGADLTGLRAALDEVDPDGRRVTPVVEILPGSSDAAGTLAVLPESFQRIALFPGGGPSAAQWDRLRAPRTAPIELTGTQLSLDLVDSTLVSERVDGTTTSVTVGVDLVDASGQPLHDSLGKLSGPTQRQRLTRPVDCADGCKLVGIWIGTLPSATVTGSATLQHVTTQPSGDSVAVGPPARWRAFEGEDGNAIEATGGSADSLTVRVDGEGAALLTLQQTWIPTVVPTLVAGALPPDSSGGSYTFAGLDGQAQDARRVGTIDRVPASPANTYVANLETLQRGRAAVSTDRFQVWFADDDPALLARVTKSLEKRGLGVIGSRTLGDVRRGFDESAAAWSLQLAVLVGVAALLIGALVLVVSAVSTWRMRARDLAALRMSGVSARATRSMAVTAQLPALAVGIVAGSLAGLAGAQLALPIVPLFTEDPEVSTLDLSTAWPAVVAATVAVVVVLGLTSLLIGRALAARADLRRLRETL
ncbi:FtsX-like permease family protein [Nocardioides sp. URHA0020]|uniref:FtsX-like permease family protein n=1 Tax=Nocardioides sp. URHA0020 TaxID=1380392 RepID=UPI00048AC3F8|nr:FtsX-like permease family protein [Nocardioides sp. URHA0020]